MKSIKEQEFEFTAWSLTGRDMPSIDGFLNGSEGLDVWASAIGQSNRVHLMELREKAFHAFKQENMPLMAAHIESLFAFAEHIGYRFSVHADAIKGKRFKPGRQAGAASPIRKAIAKLLEKSPDLKNEDLRSKIAANPPKGWAFYDNRAGKYFEGPSNQNMSYARFCNVASLERGKLRK